MYPETKLFARSSTWNLYFHTRRFWEIFSWAWEFSHPSSRNYRPKFSMCAFSRISLWSAYTINEHCLTVPNDFVCFGVLCWSVDKLNIVRKLVLIEKTGYLDPLFPCQTKYVTCQLVIAMRFYAHRKSYSHSSCLHAADFSNDHNQNFDNMIL